MHIVIMGCGRVGSTLANNLDSMGHSVAIIDQNPEAFRRLRAHFGGRRVAGFGFDRDVLTDAGVERADAFAAVSSGDNSNIISARVAREIFGVERVVARIYDPRRAEVYQRLGIPTVATVRWTADQMMRRILPDVTEPLWSDPTGSVVLAQVELHPRRIGDKVSTIEAAATTRVALLSRFGGAVVATPDTVLQEGDVVHVVAPVDDMDRISAVLASPGDDQGGR